MSAKTLILILVSVSLSATAQIFLKAGMSSDRIQAMLSLQYGSLERAAIIISNPWVLSGLALYGCGTALWLIVLGYADVTMAYPFVGLSFIITLALGYLILGEPVNTTRILGTIFVVLGVLLTARS